MVIDNFHNLYNATFKIKNSFLNKIKVPAIFRLVILQTANIIIPLVLNAQTQSYEFKLGNKEKKQTDFIVSLTSFPNRIGKVHLVIESLLRQSYCPKRIVLWLSKEQFSSIEQLPLKLLKLRERGLDIVLTEGDLRSYKKYYFLLKQQPDAAFIIVDDDVFYKSTVLANLIETNKNYPKAVCANRCAIINIDKPYSKWEGLTGESTEPRFDLLPTGCGGVLYPSNSLHEDALNDKLFSEICKDADDLWLNSCAFLNNSLVVFTGHNEYLLEVKSLNNIHLHTKNVGGANNDDRIANVRTHYKTKDGIDVFDR